MTSLKPLLQYGRVRSPPVPVSAIQASAIPPKKYGDLPLSLDSVFSGPGYYLCPYVFGRCGRIQEVQLQRLFSTFPGGWPGIGLLLLRPLVGFMLIAPGWDYLNHWSDRALLPFAVGALAGEWFCLLSGFLTPIAGGLVVLGSLVFALSSFAVPALDVFDSKLVIVNVIVISVAVALLGPCAFSLDARMFGRREISIPIACVPQKVND